MVNLASIAVSSKVIGCHTVYYKVKDDGVDGIHVNARNVLPGNRYRDRFVVRRNLASTYLSVVLLVLLLGASLGFDFVTADLKGAYIQSSPINRDIYVRPRKEYLQDVDSRSTACESFSNFPT